MAQEPAPRYFILNRLIGVADFRALLTTIFGLVLWLGLPAVGARLLGRLHRRGPMHTYLRWWAGRVARHLRITIEIDGQHHIQPGQAYLVAPLHEGFADALALLQLPLSMRFVARDELFGWRFLGPLLRDTGQICVNPERGQEAYRQIRRAAPEIIARGDSIVIFPQGTILGIESDYKRGVVALARALDVPILPVALTGGHRVWEHPFSPRLRYGQWISLVVLPPMPPSELRATGAEQARARLQTRTKAHALREGTAPPRRFDPDRDGYWDGYAYEIDPDFADLAARIAAHRRR